MAQGNRRPGRHSRQTSRITGLTNGIAGPRQIRPSQDIQDTKTVNYIKKVLCSHHRDPNAAKEQSPANEDVDTRSLEELLPPLTSSNDIDVQLYALIAVVLSIFVQSWYNKITPDQDFVQQVVQIIAHCTRGLEQRLRTVDLETLILDELPMVLEAHIEAVDIANQTAQSAVDGEAMRTVFHALRPHNALTPVPMSPEQATHQQENEGAWCQMVVNRVLSLLLPPEDLENPCLQVLVSDILSEMIFHNGICGKACESWLIWEGVTKILYAVRPDLVPSPPPEPAQIDRLEHFGLLSRVNSASEAPGQKSRRLGFDTIVGGFWATVQLVTLIWLLLRSFVTALTHASTLPARANHPSDGKTGDPIEHDGAEGLRPGESVASTSHDEKQPILALRAWPCVATLLHLHDRMPWLTGLLSLMQWLLLAGPGQLCCTDSTLDRLFSHTIRKRLLNLALVPPALQAIRTAIFPDDAMGPARVPPSPDEVVAIKRECARMIVEIVPVFVRKRYFATQDVEVMCEDVGAMLDLFADQYIDKHLIISVVELLVVRLFPEVAEEQ